MKFLPHELYHIYNRGNNSQPIFFERENYLFFLRKMKQELTPFCDVLAYCLMPNHYHLLVRVKNLNELTGSELSVVISRKLGTLQSSYTRAINRSFKRHGSLFQQKVKAKHILKYGHICFHYIHQNPLKARLCSNLQDWEFSSFPDYLGLRNGSLPNKVLALDILDVSSSSEILLKESMQSIEEGLKDSFY